MERDKDIPSKKPMGCHHKATSAKVIQALEMLKMVLLLFDPSLCS